MMRIKNVTSHYITVEVSEKLVRQDYDLVVPELARLMAVNGGRLNVLLELNNFRGWDPTALAEHIEFEVKHGHASGKVAVVGEQSDEHLGERVAHPLFSGELRFFDRHARRHAKDWLSANN